MKHFSLYRSLLFLFLSLTTIAGFCQQKKSSASSDGPVMLEIRQGEDVSNLSVFRRGGSEALVTQQAKPDFRPFLHPIIAPDGKGELTEYSPGHHKHQTGLYWGFTRINGESLPMDTVHKYFYRKDKFPEIGARIGRDFFHNPGEGYWKRVSVKVLKAEGTTVSWQTVYDLLGKDGKPILQETQQWTMREQGGKFLLALEWKGKALIDITINEFDYGGLFLRMPWTKGIPGEVVNSANQRNEKAEGQRAKWTDVGMQVGGRDNLAHIAIFDNPKNAGFPLPWRVDNQLGIGPVRARLGDWHIKSGATETIRHQIVVYTGDRNDLELTKLWNEYTGKKK